MSPGCAVFFNLDGTLTENTVDFATIYQEAVEQTGIDALSGRYEEYTDRFFHYFQNSWAFPRRQAVVDLLEEQGIEDTGESDRFASAWEELEADATMFRADASSAVESLSGQYPAGILTNGTSKLQRMKLEKNSMLDQFSTMLISAEIGLSKPNAELFKTAEDAVDTDTCIMISHDLRRDILPAKRAGFKTVLLLQDDELPDNPQMQELVDAQVESLSEVSDAVQELCTA